MSLTDLDVKQKYAGTGVQTTFPITFDAEDSTQIKVVLRDNVGAETLLAVTTHYTLTGAPATDVEMITPPAADQFLVVYRDSGDMNQPDNFPSPVGINSRLDDIYRHLQELKEKASRAFTAKISGVPAATELPEPDGDKYLGWNTGGTELENKVAVAGATGATGATGPQGGIGNTGAIGPQGIQGNPGTNGSNGFFSALASQAEAQAGTDNTKGMSPLRVAQAIVSQIGATAEIIAANAATAVNALAISSVSARLIAVEGSFQITHATGEQRLYNNTVAEDMIGKDSPFLGRGNKCALNPLEAVSAEVIFEVTRIDDGETRFTRHFMELHYINSVWYLSERDELLITGNPSGMTFGITTGAGDVVQLNYTSDNMTGGNYSLDSKIRWQLRKLSAATV